MKLSAQLKGRLRSSHQRDAVENLPVLRLSNAVTEVEAEKVSSMELDRECILERSRLVSTAPARMPYIGFYGKYNKRWYVDIVALPHNSIRTFISDVFGLLTSVYRLSLDMTERDFQYVLAFLGEFAAYSNAILLSEEKILYPEVDAALRKRVDFKKHVLHPKNRAERRRTILAMLRSLTSEETIGNPSVTVATLLQNKLDEICFQMFDYFSTKERELPKILARTFRGPKEKNRMEGKLIKHFDDLNMKYQYTAFLALPLHTDEVRADFEDRHFTKNERVLFGNAVQHMKEVVMSTPKAFDVAAQTYENRFSMAAFLEHYGKDKDVNVTTVEM
eukprot:GFKZ01011689.1.p2 GENE.GFKZ01011689.1~~GFKZ01011689.1.p2  ORF type:complete len:333 (+),score=54.05 GFKZ01011689.1:339-1337(+)